VPPGSMDEPVRFRTLSEFEVENCVSQHASGQAVMTVFVPFAVETAGCHGDPLSTIRTFIIAQHLAFGFAAATHRWKV
jgi:hypothetical protein